VTREVNPWRYGTLETSIRIVGIVLVTPFVEETIFRGVLLWKLKERTGLAIAVAGQAIIFTAFHAMSLVGSTTLTFDIAQLLAEGAYFGWVRSKTGSLYPSMAMHGLGNAVAVMERLRLV
jgi:membrane protease YdiL (CAAX protease family)